MGVPDNPAHRLPAGGHNVPSADAGAVLNGALRGDRGAVVEAFDEVVRQHGVRGAYDVAWELAGAVLGQLPTESFAALDFPGIEDARYDARWVARFVTAYANDDTPAGEALFGAAMADGQISECLMTLAGSLVATLRKRGADFSQAFRSPNVGPT